MPQASITVVINNSTKTYIYPDNSVTMPHAAITVVIDINNDESYKALVQVTIPHAAITVVIAGSGSMIFTGRIRAFWQTVNMFGTIFCKNVLLSQINRLKMLINTVCVGVLGIWQISELLSGK